MARKLIQAVGTGLDDDSELAPLLLGRYATPFAMFLCDTEADLPTPKYGHFAVVKGSGKFYWATDTAWKTVKSQHVIETEGGIDITTEDGKPIEVEH